jgi:hypothetical protein
VRSYFVVVAFLASAAVRHRLSKTQRSHPTSGAEGRPRVPLTTVAATLLLALTQEVSPVRVAPAARAGHGHFVR